MTNGSRIQLEAFQTVATLAVIKASSERLRAAVYNNTVWNWLQNSRICHNTHFILLD